MSRLGRLARVTEGMADTAAIRFSSGAASHHARSVSCSASSTATAPLMPSSTTINGTFCLTRGAATRSRTCSMSKHPPGSSMLACLVQFTRCFANASSRMVRRSRTARHTTWYAWPSTGSPAGSPAHSVVSARSTQAHSVLCRWIASATEVGSGTGRVSHRVSRMAMSTARTRSLCSRARWWARTALSASSAALSSPDPSRAAMSAVATVCSRAVNAEGRNRLSAR